MANFRVSKFTSRKLTILSLLIVMLLASLLAYVLMRENDIRSLKNQAYSLGIANSEMRDTTNIGCTIWHHAPKDISYVDGCYLHTYARYEKSRQESAVKERLKFHEWIRQSYKPDFFIMPRGTHALDTIFFKNLKGSTYCAGIEYGENTFNLHVFSSMDDNCKKMVGLNPNSPSK